jgi:hypothetical protein
MILATEMGWRTERGVVLAQHKAMVIALNNAARAAKPGVGLRREKAILREVARQQRVARQITVAELHLYPTR